MKTYFIGFSIVWTWMLAVWLCTEPLDMIYWVSVHRTKVGDDFFAIVTHGGEGIAYILAIVVLLFVRFRYALMVPLIGISSLGLSAALKDLFVAPRPYHVLMTSNRLDWVQFPDGYAPIQSAQSSFPSGHTLSAFALLGFLAFVLSPRWLKIACLVLATLVGISRVYLVCHFPADVCAGAMLGTLLAIMFWLVQSSFARDEKLWWNKRLSLS